MRSKTYRNPIGVGRFTGLLLVSPFIAGFLLFGLYPFLSSLVLSLTEFDGIHTPRFVGLENYSAMFRSSDLRNAVRVSLTYTAVLVPLKLIFSLLTAMLLNAEIKGIGAFRTIFYIPSILGSNMAVVIMWQFLFTGDGLVNQLLGIVGISPVGWYGDPSHALGIIILLRLWEFGSTMVIFLNALRDVPAELYDAAKVDGCSKIRAFFAITLPMLRNVIFLNLVLQIIAAMQEFNAPYMITGGGPMKGTYTLGMLIYDEMFRYHDAGAANAVSWAMFVIITAIVGLLFLHTGRQEEKT